MSDFDPKPLLLDVYAQTCAADPRNRRAFSTTSGAIYCDDMPDADDRLFLAVVVPGRKISTTLKVDAQPVSSALPAGKGIVRVRMGSSRNSVTTRRFHVPAIVSADTKNPTEHWVELNDDDTFKATTFADMWHTLNAINDPGVEGPPLGSFVYANGAPKPVFK